MAYHTSIHHSHLNTQQAHYIYLSMEGHKGWHDRGSILQIKDKIDD